MHLSHKSLPVLQFEIPRVRFFIYFLFLKLSSYKGGYFRRNFFGRYWKSSSYGSEYRIFEFFASRRVVIRPNSASIRRVYLTEQRFHIDNRVWTYYNDDLSGGVFFDCLGNQKILWPIIKGPSDNYGRVVGFEKG